MIIKAIEQLKERTGSSTIAISKYIHANYTVADDEKTKSLMRAALKRGV